MIIVIVLEIKVTLCGLNIFCDWSLIIIVMYDLLTSTVINSLKIHRKIIQK
jgi:hypothetical protein